MLVTILVAGIAIGAIYAMIGLSYNMMYATSKVVSSTHRGEDHELDRRASTEYAGHR